MKGERRALADELYASGRAYDAAQADRLARWRNVEPETAELLGVLVRAMGAHRVLEIGTSNGYSTLWLADAAQAVGGTVVTLEMLAERTELAGQNLARAELSDLVDLRTVDAGAGLAAFEEGSFDLVFLDAERPAYAGYWPDLVRVLAQPGPARGRQRHLPRRPGRRLPRPGRGRHARGVVARADRGGCARGGASAGLLSTAGRDQPGDASPWPVSTERRLRYSSSSISPRA